MPCGRIWCAEHFRRVYKMSIPNFQLAAALFSRAAEPVPHDSHLDEEAQRLEHEIGDRETILSRILQLCGKPALPEQYFLCTGIYSRLGKEFAADVIRCGEAYLGSKGWSQLDEITREEDGIRVDAAKSSRASLYTDLAAAYETTGQLEKAYSCARRAYLLEPYREEYAGKAADLLFRLRGKKEAMDFLLEQRNSFYYRPIRYRDVFGNGKVNDRFRRQLDDEIHKCERRRDIK